jgi:ubiquinone/menaquinone biosynthesis C-methylase UbiE
MTKNLWDRMVSRYIISVREDKNADYAYEDLVNSLSVLSLCDIRGNVLDLGCGDGRFTRLLEGRYEKTCAIDYSKKMLKYARKKCKQTTFIYHDLEKPFPNFNLKFDVVTAKLLLMYIEDIQSLGTEVYKILTPGGSLIVSVTHPLKWVVEEKRGTVGKNYKGYLSEVPIQGAIAKDDNLTTRFINRTFQTYVNTFAKSGFYLQTVAETGVPDSFVIEYPQYFEFQKKPYRLNLKFIRK